MTKLPPNPNDLLTLITLLTLPLKVEHIYYISSAWKKQANEIHLEKHTNNVKKSFNFVEMVS